jgi:hypothetical protein
MIVVDSHHESLNYIFLWQSCQQKTFLFLGYHGTQQSILKAETKFTRFTN